MLSVTSEIRFQTIIHLFWIIILNLMVSPSLGCFTLFCFIVFRALCLLWFLSPALWHLPPPLLSFRCLRITGCESNPLLL